MPTVRDHLHRGMSNRPNMWKLISYKSAYGALSVKAANCCGESSALLAALRYLKNYLNLKAGQRRYWCSCSCMTTINSLQAQKDYVRERRLQRLEEPYNCPWKLLQLQDCLVLSSLPELFFSALTSCPGVLQRLKDNRVKHFQMCLRITLTSYYLLIWCHSPTVCRQLTSRATGFCLKGHNLAGPCALK